MSTNYRETTVTGQSWQRCNQIVIENPRHATPVVRFEEEQVLALQSGEVRTPVGSVAMGFDPAKTIPLRDPATGELTGHSTSYGDAYVILYSAYLAAVAERDEPAQE